MARKLTRRQKISYAVRAGRFSRSTASKARKSLREGRKSTLLVEAIKARWQRLFERGKGVSRFGYKSREIEAREERSRVARLRRSLREKFEEIVGQGIPDLKFRTGQDWGSIYHPQAVGDFANYEAIRDRMVAGDCSDVEQEPGIFFEMLDIAHATGDPAYKAIYDSLCKGMAIGLVQNRARRRRRELRRDLERHIRPRRARGR